MPKRIILPCEELRRLYEDERFTTVALSRRYGCSITTVANQLRRCGATLRNGRFTARVVPLDELVRLYVDERWPLPSIAQHFGVSISTIYNRLSDANAPKRRSHRLREGRTVVYRLRRRRDVQYI